MLTYKTASKEQLMKLQEELDKETLGTARELLRKPDMTLEEMKEMNARPRPNTISVTFLKKK